MSTKKKRERALQHDVRERQAKTGESYQAAWWHLTTRTSSASASPGARRVPLSMSTGVKVLPGQSAQITARAQLASFWPDRLLIKNADRWDIHRLAVGEDKFALIKAGSRKATTFSLDTWQPLTTREVGCGEAIVLVVSYTGENRLGESFEATLFGWEGCPPTTAPSTDRHEDGVRVSERFASGNVLPGQSIKLPLTIAAPTLFVDRLTITDAKDWVVHDVRTHGKTIFVQAGDLPGEMFSDSECVILEPLTIGSRIEVVATYLGSSPSACLQIELSGSTKLSSTSQALSYFLPMSAGQLILPSQAAQITAQITAQLLPDRLAILPAQSVQITAQITGTRQPEMNFLPERLVIADPDAWIINGITIGIRHQFAALGDLPGQSFASCAIGSHMTLDPVRRGQEFVLVTTRGEDCKEAAPFFCGVQGRLFPDASVVTPTT